MPTPPKRKRLKRRIVISGRETPTDRQSRTAVRFIMDNKHYSAILKAIRDGHPNGVIAEHAISRGWMDVSQKTAVAYLQYFRRAQPGLCKPDEHRELEGAPFGYSDLFDAQEAIVDTETELVRLIKLQQARLGIAFRNELQIQMLMSDNRREVEELRNLLMDLAKLRGLTSDRLDIKMMAYPESVKEDLKSLQQEESQRSNVAMLVRDLVSVSVG